MKTILGKLIIRLLLRLYLLNRLLQYLHLPLYPYRIEYLLVVLASLLLVDKYLELLVERLVDDEQLIALRHEELPQLESFDELRELHATVGVGRPREYLMNNFKRLEIGVQLILEKQLDNLLDEAHLPIVLLHELGVLRIGLVDGSLNVFGKLFLLRIVQLNCHLVQVHPVEDVDEQLEQSVQRPELDHEVVEFLVVVDVNLFYFEL